MNPRLPFFISVFGLLVALSAQGQTDTLWRPVPGDTLQVVGSDELNTVDTLFHSPQKALVRSLIVPGLGQAYNKKYWKIPIIYAALGTSVYFIIDNNRQYDEFKQAYIDRQNGLEDDYPQYTDDNLITLTDFYRRNRDFSVILTAGIYLINVLDAMVDAHLYEFDVSVELSIEVQPQVHFTPQMGPRPAVGFTLKF